MGIRTGSLVVLLAAGVVAGCASEGPTADEAAAETDAAPPEVEEWFVDVASEAGMVFAHFNGMSGEFYDSEVFPPGAALVDFDNDGDLDVYLVQGQMLNPDKSLNEASFPPVPAALPLRDRLFRNDLDMRADGSSVLRFADVTEQAGIVTRDYGMGMAVGDVDNDGWPDLYRTAVGPNQLFRNNRDGTFTDVSAPSGIADDGWGVSASFFDFDRDGWLDLHVGNYLRYSVETDVACSGAAGQPDYCAPTSYRAEADRLYRNQGDGTFADVTGTALLGSDVGPALGAVAADFNGDEWPDLYVANDGQADFLWINQQNGTFSNMGLLAGVAFNRDGRATASMGVDAGDFDNDGDEDIFHVNLTGEGHTLLVNDGTGLFNDVTRDRGLMTMTLPFTGFGTAWFDVDNDGWLDLLIVNGAVRTIEALARAGDRYPLHQRRQLLRNRGDGRFDDVTDVAGDVFERTAVGRGAAFGDVDNDGDVDVLVANNNGLAELLVNQIGNRRHWLGLRVVGEDVERDMVGARVGVVRADGQTLWRRARSDGSFASANDPRVLVGLGDTEGPVGVRVVWPDGRVEQWDGIAIDQWMTLREGSSP